MAALMGRRVDMTAEVTRLIQSRRYQAALARLESPDIMLAEPERLRLQRRCLARMRQFEDAATCGEALLQQARGDGEAEDFFRQAQILLECRLWERALEAGLAAAAMTPDDDRLVCPLAHAVLAEPRLLDQLVQGLARLPPVAERSTGGSGRGADRTTVQRIFVPLRLPYYRSYDAAHPGTMGMVERTTDLDFCIPDHFPQPWRNAMLPALRHALAVMAPLMAVHPLIDRAAAARYVADRFPSLLADHGGAHLDFLSNLPMTLGQRPWVLWYDIPGTLFQPFMPFEETDVTANRSALYWIIRSFLESDACLRIITHYPLDGHPLSALFGSRTIHEKLVFINPWHSSDTAAPRSARLPAAFQTGKQPIRMLFTSSFQNREEGFYYRGGVDVLTAFLELSERFDDIELVVRATMPSTLGDDLRARASAHPRIRWIQDHVPEDTYRSLMSGIDLFLLPSVVLYKNGLLQAMEAGQVPIVSDIPGIESLIRPGENGIVVPGRGAFTVIDSHAGAIRHNWLPLLQAVDAPANSIFHTAFTAKLLHLLENRSEIQAMSKRNLAQADVTADGRHDLDRFRAVMGQALRQAIAIGPDGDRPSLPTYG